MKLYEKFTRELMENKMCNILKQQVVERNGWKCGTRGSGNAICSVLFLSGQLSLGSFVALCKLSDVFKKLLLPIFNPTLWKAWQSGHGATGLVHFFGYTAKSKYFIALWNFVSIGPYPYAYQACSSFLKTLLLQISSNENGETHNVN